MSSYLDKDGNIDLDALSSGYEPLPLGVYTARLTAVSHQEAKDLNSGETLIGTWEVTEGERSGEQVFIRYSFTAHETKAGKPIIYGVLDLLKDFAAAGVPFDPAKEVLSQNCAKNAKLYGHKLKGKVVRIQVSERAGKDKATGESRMYRNIRILDAAPQPQAQAKKPVVAAPPVETEDSGDEYFD